MALIAVAADKGSPGVTTTSVALAGVWPRPVLLAECDPAGGDLVYRLPAAGGGQLDPRRGLLSLAVAARRGLAPQHVWEHAQKLGGGLDVLAGVTSADQAAGLERLWGPVGAVLAAQPQADVIADCGRIGADGPLYDLLAHAAMIVLVTRAGLGDVVRLRDRVTALRAAMARRGQPGIRIGVVVIAAQKRFRASVAEVDAALTDAAVIGGIAFEPKSAEQLCGQWGGRLDRSLLIRSTRHVAVQLARQTAARVAPSGGPPVNTLRPPATAAAPAAPVEPAPAASPPLNGVRPAGGNGGGPAATLQGRVTGLRAVPAGLNDAAAPGGDPAGGATAPRHALPGER